MRKIFFSLALLIAIYWCYCVQSKSQVASQVHIGTAVNRVLAVHNNANQTISSHINTNTKTSKNLTYTRERRDQRPRPFDEIVSGRAVDSSVKLEFVRSQFFRRVWEARRLTVYSSLQLSPVQLFAIEQARYEFSAETDEYIAIMQLPGSSDNEVSQAINNLDESIHDYDTFVENTVGPEKFAFLAEALSNMNAEIEAHSTSKFQFVSAW